MKVYIFVPKLDSVVCPTEIRAMNKHSKILRDQGIEIYVVNHESYKAWNKFRNSTDYDLSNVRFRSSPLLTIRNRALFRRVTIINVKGVKLRWEHPLKVSRSFEEINRTIKGILTDDYCPEGFK